jgi:4-amino-4-deoxy-L-arabinose transferase-like glycosyltransferase
MATLTDDPSVQGTSEQHRRLRADAKTCWPILALALLAMLAFGAAFGVRHWLVPLGTGDADEGVYASEAQLLRAGDATFPTATHVPFFRPWLTGERQGHLFFQYEPGWPAALALTDAVFGSKVAAGALGAAGLVLAVHALALEALGSRRTALIAAALCALSPIFLLHSALYLAYIFTTLLATLTLWCAFCAVKRASPGWAVATGALLGAMLLTRPFDAVLTGVTVAAVGLLSPGRSWARLVRLALLAAAAAAPFVVLALLFNQATTGSLTTFPLSASDPRNKFGFGGRGMQVGTSALDYTPSAALRALGANLRGACGWVFGGVATVVLAALSSIRRDRRPARLALGLNLVLFPAGYFFWWATVLASASATNGIGPHYFIPSFVPLVVLGADELARVSRRHVVAAAGLALAMAAVTAYNVPDKIDNARFTTSLLRGVDRGLSDRPDRSLIFIRSDRPEAFTLNRYPYLTNAPRLDGSVLFPVDRQGENGRLIRSRPDRRAYLLHQEIPPHGDIFKPRWVLTRQTARSNRSVPLRVRLSPPSSGPQFRAYATSEDDSVEQRLDQASGTSSTFPVTLVATSTGAGPTGNVLRLAPGPQGVVVGLRRTDTGERWQRRYDVVVDSDGTVTVVRPGVGEHVVDFGRGPVTIHEDVSPTVADVS